METYGMWYEILSPLKPRLHGVVPSYGTPQTLSEVPSWETPFGPKMGTFSMSAEQMSFCLVGNTPFWTLSSGGPEVVCGPHER